MNNIISFLKSEEEIGLFLAKLNEANVPTRYPEDLEKLKANYTKQIVGPILVDTKRAYTWIKQQF